MCLPSCTALRTPRRGSPAYKKPGQGEPSIGAGSRERPADELCWLAASGLMPSFASRGPEPTSPEPFWDAVKAVVAPHTKPIAPSIE